ncbi:MAG: agmatinase [Thermococci archaeon]|nr:agmatinase [Thermococci archaeon]
MEEFLYTYNGAGFELPTVGVEDAKLVIIGVPFDGTASYRPGSRFGPGLIRQASLNLESYVIDYDVDLAGVPLADAGDIAIVAGDARRTAERVRETVEDLKRINPDALPIILGGEHSMTLGAVEALRPASYVVFDAHLDLRDSYEDNPYSHACVARRIHELGIREAMFGIRSGTREEVDYAARNGVTWVHARNYSFDRFMEAVEDLPEPLYLSVDVDVFDVSLVPSTGTPEAGGLGFWDVVTAIEWLLGEKEIVGFDVMETAGSYLGDPTAVTAAKLLFYFMAAYASR